LSKNEFTLIAGGLNSKNNIIISYAKALNNPQNARYHEIAAVLDIPDSIKILMQMKRELASYETAKGSTLFSNS
jgi:hypothetical protein